jgi:hypothetical protein
VPQIADTAAVVSGLTLYRNEWPQFLPGVLQWSRSPQVCKTLDARLSCVRLHTCSRRQERMRFIAQFLLGKVLDESMDQVAADLVSAPRCRCCRGYNATQRPRPVSRTAAGYDARHARGRPD